MPLSKDEVARLEASQSRYGCGDYTCEACHPIQYACDYCFVLFPEPIANGEAYACVECGYDNVEGF